MTFNLNKTSDPNVFIIQHGNYVDHRGVFSKLFCFYELELLLPNLKIVQINHSLTKKKGSIRGFHFQKVPYNEIKIVKVLKGAIFDVALNLRTGEHVSETLIESNNKMMLIPNGYAHGFQTLEDNTEILYLHSKPYSPSHESGINPFDSHIDIPWPLDVAECSLKDQKLPNFHYEYPHEV